VPRTQNPPSPVTGTGGVAANAADGAAKVEHSIVVAAAIAKARYAACEISVCVILFSSVE